MGRIGCVAALLLVAVVPAPAAPQDKGQWIVVTAPAFREAIEPLRQHRQADGLHVEVVATSDVLSRDEIKSGAGGKLREHVAKLCRAHKGPSYVLLVGAIEAGQLVDADKKVVPALAGTTGRMKGYPSDNSYGCLDKELLPTVAIGRFPARTEEEVRQMVRKTIAFEKDRAPGAWRRQLTILAGVPAFNPLVDRLVESMALGASIGSIPPGMGGLSITTRPRVSACPTTSCGPRP